MKLSKTIKRIAAVGAGATMLGATVLGAMAADLSEYPKPMFIKDGKFDGLIVIGADADTQDMLGAMDIISSLQAVAVGASGTTSATVETVGDVYQFARASNKLNIGESMNDIRSTIDKAQLPIVLADGSLTTAKGSKYEYEQEIKIPSTSSAMTFFTDKDYENEKPVVGIKISRNSDVLSYNLTFNKNAESSVGSSTSSDPDGLIDLDDRQIEILGETYDIIDTDNSTANLKLDLMKGALKPTLEEGETGTYKINGKDYEVTALIIDDTNDKVKFKVNGEVTDSMVAGDVYKTSDGTLIGVREILPNEAGDVTQDMVEFYLGANKIVLENGQELSVNEEDVSRMNVVVAGDKTGSKTYISKISLGWVADDDIFLTEDGNEVVMPGLESIKLYMNGFYNGKEEITTIEPSGDDTVTISAPLAKYDVKLDILFSGTPGIYNNTGSGYNKRLITTTCSGAFQVDQDTDAYFVVTKYTKGTTEGQTDVLQLSKVDTTDGVTIKDYTGNVVASNKKTNGQFDVADDLVVTVGSYDKLASAANFTVSGSCANNALVTKEGLLLTLPPEATTISQQNTTRNLSSSSIDCSINASFSSTLVVNLTSYFQANETNVTNIVNGSKLCYATSFTRTVTEEDKDENLGNGKAFGVTIGFDATNETSVNLVSKTNFSNGQTYQTLENDKKYVGYINGTVSAKVTEDKVADQHSIEISYPGEETYGDLFIGSKASKVTTSASGESVAVSKIEVGAAVLDGSLASYTNQNLIVVGGPAINKAAAALLGKTYPAYGAESGIPENAGLIKLVEQTDGTVAMIVAGWEADDTQRACRVVAESGDYALSGKEVQITGTSMTDIQVGVPATA